MRKNIVRLTLGALLLALGLPAQAQQPAGIPRIGILIPASASFFSARVEAFRQRLRELGYVEGKNIVIEYRYAEGKTRTAARPCSRAGAVSKLTSSSPPVRASFSC